MADRTGYTATTLSDVAFDDVQLSLAGINLMLNNGFREAESIFLKYKNYSPLMSGGYSFVCFLNAIMSFEEDKMEFAMVALKETEKMCTVKKAEKSLRVKIFGNNSNTKKTLLPITLEDRLQRLVIYADCQLYMSMIIFSRFEISGFMKGGWLIRKAFKLYERIYNEIAAVYKDRFGQDITHPNQTKLPESETVPVDDDANSNDGTENLENLDFSDITEESLGRLKGAVSFGFGLLQLCISMMPPNVLKLVNMFGFHGDKEFGLTCLEEASRSTDMKAPLAMLSLLWYHTVVRPFFGIDGSNTEHCIREAKEILEVNEVKYSQSALVMFYRGRVQKLECNLEESLKTYNEAYDLAVEQREIQLICLYEIGWCSIIKLNWEEGLLAFARLKEDSRWSKCYYAYLTGVCQGALGQLETAQEMFKEVPKLSKRKNNQLEAFVIRKSNKFKKKLPTKPAAILMVIEIVYLWRALPSCSQETLDTMIETLDNATLTLEEQALCRMLKGALHQQMGSKEAAMQNYEDAMAYAVQGCEDPYVAPYCSFELGMLLTEKPSTASRGKALILRAKENYKDFDFENRLNVRVHAALQQLEGID
ncbi:tetratricopeptide repeat protein 39C-like [Anneissia japonica]|uniref:tetratricopeptide repeat protein 39C-like n=1 Tax=Anneissia japonica TaxID=1529436 RepID=UPI0014255B60|nr:tetratricopeptide repeat protein 39C-like [Anneissia japonica]